MANREETQTGGGEVILKRMLPVVATMVMGTLSKQPAMGLQGARGGNEPSGVMAMPSSFLDTNRDGSVTDDVLGFVNNFSKNKVQVLCQSMDDLPESVLDKEDSFSNLMSFN